MAVLNGTSFAITTLAGQTASSNETEVSFTISQSVREVITKDTNGLRQVLPGVTSASGSFSALLDTADYATWQSIAATMTADSPRSAVSFVIGDGDATSPFQMSVNGVLTELTFSGATEENTSVSGSFELNVDQSLTS